MTSVSAFPRPRTLVHPGPFDPVRIRSLRAVKARHVRLLLEPGRSLFDALVEPLRAEGIENASTTILIGEFAHLEYCVAPPDPARRAVIAYGPPIDAGAATMVFGNATLGKDRQGAPLVHCHATVRRADGLVRGGHMLTERCIVGSEPISVLVTSLDGFELRQTFDPETNIPLLVPVQVTQ